MPYEAGVAILTVAMVVVFATFAYLLVNARGLMLLFRRISGGEIEPGPGSPRASKRGAAIALVLHFAGWAVAALVWLYLIADIRATAPDTTPLEEAGLVEGNRQ